MSRYRTLCERYRDARRRNLDRPTVDNRRALERAHAALWSYRRVCRAVGVRPSVDALPTPR